MVNIIKKQLNSGCFKKGHITWNKDTKGLSKSNNGSFKKGDKPWWTKKGLPHPMLGLFKKGHPALSNGETYFKKGHKPYFNSENKPTKEQVHKMLARRPMSSLEIKMQGIIDKNNLPYKFVGNGEFFIERKNPDFVNINGKKIAIEVYYKKHKERFKGSVDIWKQERSDIFNKYGWKLLFFDEIQVREEIVLKTIEWYGEGISEDFVK